MIIIFEFDKPFLPLRWRSNFINKLCTIRIVVDKSPYKQVDSMFYYGKIYAVYGSAFVVSSFPKHDRNSKFKQIKKVKNVSKN